MRYVATIVTAALAGGAAWAQVDPAAQAKVARFADAQVAAAGIDPSDDLRYRMTFVDLNRDGMPEALLTLDGRDWCGTMGCSAWVLDLTGAEAQSLGDFISHEMQALGTMTNGWHDLSLNGHRQVMRGGSYGRMGP